MKPTIERPDLTLRPARNGDLASLAALLALPEIRKYLCDDAVLPREVIARMLERSCELDGSGLGLWAIEVPNENFAGICGIQPVSEVMEREPAMRGGLEVLAALRPELWGRGLATTAVKALASHAGSGLGLTRLVAGVDAPNLASHRLVQRCGFERIGSVPGLKHTLVLYELRLPPSSS